MMIESFYVLLHIAIPCFFFFNDTATTEIYTLSLHDALPISRRGPRGRGSSERRAGARVRRLPGKHRVRGAARPGNAGGAGRECSSGSGHGGGQGRGGRPGSRASTAAIPGLFAVSFTSAPPRRGGAGGAHPPRV